MRELTEEEQKNYLMEWIASIVECCKIHKLSTYHFLWQYLERAEERHSQALRRNAPPNELEWVRLQVELLEQAVEGHRAK